MKKSLLALALIGFGIIFGCLLGESLLTIHHYFTQGTLSRAALIARRAAQLPAPVGPVISPGTDRWVNQLMVHPFFGYVHNPELPGVNNFGFLSPYDIVLTDSGYSLADSEGEELDDKARHDRLIVGLFGGSFVERMHAEGSSLEAKLKALFPNKTPIVLNFGIGGHALPQAAFIFLYFQKLFDVAVFLDGLNEIWNAVDNNQAGFPPEYAKAAHFQYKLSLSELTPERFQLTAQILSLRRWIAELTRLSLLPLVRHSLGVDLVWQTLTRYWAYEVSTKSVQIRDSYTQQHAQFFAQDETTLIRHAVQRWFIYHGVLHTLAASQGILDIHLLQPNPFVKDSKVLTAEERNSVTHSFNIRRHVASGYPQLQAAVLQLQQASLIAHDLSMLYQPIEETIWIDAAHPNQVGNAIIVARIAELIAQHYVSPVRLPDDQQYQNLSLPEQ